MGSPSFRHERVTGLNGRICLSLLSLLVLSSFLASSLALVKPVHSLNTCLFFVFFFFFNQILFSFKFPVHPHLIMVESDIVGEIRVAQLENNYFFSSSF